MTDQTTTPCVDCGIVINTGTKAPEGEVRCVPCGIARVIEATK